ncbi:HD domain-containing protein [Flavobacteriales bacterium]|nr:HD domain-containing protein [Flavobacteriales bacterium]
MAARPKLLNDPVYGFIQLRHADFTEIMDHPWVQRLRRISQLGMSHLVYPGAVHNRFHHALGALHLMQEALDSLREKGIVITEDEYRGACMAILLHDVGHGPFSHALEHTLVRGVHHEEISTLIMTRLNEEFNGMLDTAIDIFNDHHPKGFLHDLVSSQLDMDRMDYLRRDSFFTGVSEGQISSERIIRMLNVHEGRLVVEEKGIYSIEKFIISRRLMYWQVYLHKTVLAAEWMMMGILERARDLVLQGEDVWTTPALRPFLSQDLDRAQFMADPEVLATFCALDDSDVMCCIKSWQNHPDQVLSDLSRRLTHRKLFKIELRDAPFNQDDIAERITAVEKLMGLSTADAACFVLHDRIDNRAYSTASHGIGMLFKDGTVRDAASASDHLNLSTLSVPVERHFLAYPKELPPRPTAVKG